MDGPRGYYAKWNKSDRERQILYDFIYMESKKAKQMNKHNKTQNHKYREQTSGFQRGGGVQGWEK